MIQPTLDGLVPFVLRPPLFEDEWMGVECVFCGHIFDRHVQAILDHAGEAHSCPKCKRTSLVPSPAMVAVS